jgi:hypothetical protein
MVAVCPSRLRSAPRVSEDASPAPGQPVVAQDGSGIRPALAASDGIGIKAQLVVHVPELVLASEIALGRPDRDVPRRELNLIQFSAAN